MARLAQDVDELREYWDHERIVVIGHSAGATLALIYAATYPDRAAEVVYLGGVGIGDWRTPYYAELGRRMRHRSTYRSTSPPAVAHAARDSASGAVAIGSPALVRSAREAFVHGMGITLWVCSGIALAGLVLALVFLPRRSGVATPEPEKVATIGA